MGAFCWASEEMALKLHFHQRGKLASTEGNKCTLDERNIFLGAVRVAILETYIPNGHAATPAATAAEDADAAATSPPWWCYGLCHSHEEGEYCAVVHPACPLQVSEASIAATQRRQLHENRLLPVRELSRQTHPSELRKDRSTADQKLICRGTRVSFLTRVHELISQQQQQQPGIADPMLSDACLFFLKHRFDLECYAVQPQGRAEMFQLSSKPQELRRSILNGSKQP
jgi:hypothetical protein